MPIQCGQMPATFFEMLASCVMRDPTTQEILGLNVILADSTECECEPAIETHIDPEQFVAANCFVVDKCGNLALKLVNCGDDINPIT